MTDITNMTDAEIDALLSPEPADEHVYWYHKTAAKNAYSAANRLANKTNSINLKRKYQPAAVVALYALATAHATAAAGLA